MDLEVSGTVTGALVPIHLLHFEGDSVMKSYYRYILETNYQKGITKRNSYCCQICHADLISNQPRIKPGMKPTKKINKLVSSMKSKSLNTKELSLVKRYLNSSVNLTVKCCECGNMSKILLITTENKLKLKSKLLKSKMMDLKMAASSTKKKKKKKKKMKEVDPNCGLNISGSCDTMHIPSSLHKTPPATSIKDQQPTMLSALKAKHWTSTPLSTLNFHTKSKSSRSAEVKAHASQNKAGDASKNVFKQEQKRKLFSFLTKNETPKDVTLSDFLSSL
ncbi:hypothetical protein Btru_011164 [Bulinus truncatus]|nr:hypothetical protein Btru_011164 [Bulinus truncatus]